MLFPDCQRTPTRIVGLLLLLSLAAAYNLEGQWQLTPQHLNYTEADPRVIFQFVNRRPGPSLAMPVDTLDDGTRYYAHSGTRQLTVHSCLTLRYNYYVNATCIYLQPIEVTGSNRQCQPNQVEQLSARLNSTFFFHIARNQLILYYPSMNQSMTLLRDDPTQLRVPNGAYELWHYESLPGRSSESITDKPAYFGNSTIDFCGFRSKYNYEVRKMNNIATSAMKSECQDPEMERSIRDAFFYLQTGRTMTLYDRQLKQIGKLSYQRTINSTQFEQDQNAALNAGTPIPTDSREPQGNDNLQDGSNSTGNNNQQPQTPQTTQPQQPATAPQPQTQPAPQTVPVTQQENQEPLTTESSGPNQGGQPQNEGSDPATTPSESNNQNTQQDQGLNNPTSESTTPATSAQTEPSENNQPVIVATDPVQTQTQPTQQAPPATQPAQPATESTQPQTQPQTQPVQPQTDAVSPQTQPTQPAQVQPLPPQTQPAPPQTQPVSPSTQPVQPQTQPASPQTQPQTQPVQPQTQPQTVPIEPATVPPAQPQTQPIQPQTQPAQPQTLPPIVPTAPQTQPTQPQTQPIAAPPTEPQTQAPQPQTQPVQPPTLPIVIPPTQPATTPSTSTSTLAPPVSEEVQSSATDPQTNPAPETLQSSEPATEPTPAQQPATDAPQAQPVTEAPQPVVTEPESLPSAQPQSTASESSGGMVVIEQGDGQGSSSQTPVIPATSSGAFRSFLRSYGDQEDDKKDDECKCLPVSTRDSLTPFNQSSLYNKWYLYSINGSQYSISQYYYYFLIINSNRMIYYGGCEVRFSPYTITDNEVSGVDTKVSQKHSCIEPNFDDKVLGPFFQLVKYINYDKYGGDEYIIFYDKDLKHLATFTTDTPTNPRAHTPDDRGN